MTNRSDLIKLANGKWLVRIRDVSEHSNVMESQFFELDNNGNVEKSKHGINTFKCDPFAMALAADSGYFMFEQGVVTKYDKNFTFASQPLWQRRFASWDYPNYAATTDSGVLCTYRGIIFKYDKDGHDIEKKKNP